MALRMLFRAVIVTSILILQLAGCGNNETSTESDSSDTSASHLVTFIELGSVNCVPCQMMQPVMEELEKNFPNDLEVLFYDVWTKEQSRYAEEYGIRVIPTQVFLDKNGNEFYRHEGFFPYEQVVEVLKDKGVGQ
jgi:thioredoxin 1